MYAKPERQADLATLKRLLPPLAAGRHVLEIAAGTGYWSQVLATTAAAITATDLNAETLQVAARRDFGAAVITLRIADAYRLQDVPGDFDLVFCGFWWSHVRRADIGRFLAGIRGRAAPGTRLVLARQPVRAGQQSPHHPDRPRRRYLPAAGSGRRARVRGAEELPRPRVSWPPTWPALPTGWAGPSCRTTGWPACTLR